MKDILQLYKDADISEFVLMSREQPVAVNAEAKSSDVRGQADTAKGSPASHQSAEVPGTTLEMIIPAAQDQYQDI